MELLSPAKNLETGIVAINSGADAVYIGADDFGARKAAANSLSSIEQLCKYAHFYGAKVYVTLNTILYDNELIKAEKMIHQLYNIGVDALIIQDFGILEMDIPNIELHASTQTHNYDMERIKFLDNLGFKRIVLARESSIEHIRNVKNNIKAEIECFVHGALCVSFSGQCYMSAQLGGRSANRGECAQACRMKYSLINANKKVLINDSYILSLRDLATFSKIDEMMNIGVNSLKIEGRLKDICYVANVTGYYRRIIDEISDHKAKNSSGICFYDYEPNINKVFNRGFTEYFLNNKTEKMANFASPKSMGEYIGKYVATKNKTLIISTKETLNNGDGLCFVKDNQLFGFRVEKSVGDNAVVVNTEQIIKPGTEIFRNFDSKFQKKIEHSKTMRKIRINIKASFKDNNHLIVTLLDEDNLISEAGIVATELAQNQERAISNIKNALSKCGEKYQVMSTEFYSDNSNAPFIANSVVNDLRRQLILSHEQKRIEHFKPKGFPIPKGDVKYCESVGNYRLNVSNSLAKKFYENHGCKISQMAFELLDNTQGLEVMTTKYCIRREMGYCLKTCKNVPQQWQGENFELLGNYQNFALKIDCQQCVMHLYSIKK